MPYLWEGLRPLQNFMTHFRTDSILKPTQIAEVLLLVASFIGFVFGVKTSVRFLMKFGADLFDLGDYYLLYGFFG